MVRNRQMLTEGRPDLVVAFPGGKGTANMVALARKAGVEIVEVQA
jgi:predicted Rossmann-fold nucleotide-binding protein